MSNFAHAAGKGKIKILVGLRSGRCLPGKEAVGSVSTTTYLLTLVLQLDADAVKCLLAHSVTCNRLMSH